MNQLTTPVPLNIALDPGFHAIKLSTVCQGEVLTVVLPSIVGVGDTELGLLSTGGLTRQRRSRRPHELRMNGQSFLVGKHVHQFARPIERLDFDRLSYALELKALVYAGLGILLRKLKLEPQDVHINLIAALPVQVLQSPKARAVVSALESWLVGWHEFVLDSQFITFEVGSLKAMAQPLGSFFEWGLTPEGKWGRKPEDLKARIGVLDQGFNTLDLFSLDGGQIVRRYTGGETLGMRRAAQLMQTLIEKQTGRKVSLHEADGYVRTARDGRRTTLVVRGKAYDLKPLAKQAVDVALGEVRAFLSRQWEDGGQFDYILITGGGALVLGSRLQAAFPQAFTLPEAVTANARGLAKFAQRNGVFPQRPNQVA